MIVTGEASGDLHGAGLVKAIMDKGEDLFFFGIGGRHLRNAGVKVYVDSAELSVVGITEVFSKIPKLYRSNVLAKKLLSHLAPDLLILIDFPDFNLMIARFAKKLGIPVLYYISPQIWAWRKKRVNKIKRRVDHVAVILPFEEKFYHAHGVPATFVGHPLLDTYNQVPEDAHAPHHFDAPVIGLLPGSRDREIARHLPLMLEAAQKLSERDKRLRFVVSLAPSANRHQIAQLVRQYPLKAAIQLTDEPVEKVFKKTTVVVAASGTVTLEAALFGIPMVIIYKVSPLSYWLGRTLIHVRHIGLVNLIADRSIVPELIQKDASPANIAEAVSKMLVDPSELERIRKALFGVREMLGGPGAAERVSKIALKVLYGNSKVSF